MPSSIVWLRSIDARVRIAVAIGDAALVRLGDDRLVADAHGADHQQAQVAHDVVGERLVCDVVAVDVEAERIAAKAAAVGEVDLEVELRAFVGHWR